MYTSFFLIFAQNIAGGCLLVGKEFSAHGSFGNWSFRSTEVSLQRFRTNVVNYKIIEDLLYIHVFVENESWHMRCFTSVFNRLWMLACVPSMETDQSTHPHIILMIHFFHWHADVQCLHNFAGWSEISIYLILAFVMS